MRRPARIVVLMLLAALAVPASAAATHLPGDDIEDARPVGIGQPNTIAGYSGNTYTNQTGAGEDPELDCAGDDIGLWGSAWWVVRQGKRRLSATVTGPLGKTAALHPTGEMDSWVWCAYNGGTGAASFTFPETYAEGAELYIRAGACYEITGFFYCDAGPSGDLTMRVTSAPPGNDARGSATEVGVGPQQVFDNHGSTEESENLTCTSNGKTAPFKSTVWFKYTPTKFGTATFSASHVHSDHMDNVLAVYRGGDAQPAACFDNPNTSDGSSTVTMGVNAGQTYFVQVGSYATADPVAAQGTFLYEVQFTTNDSDGDGDPDGSDCAPDNPSIRHGATDVPHNNVDEDCVGGDNKDEDGDKHNAVSAGGGDCNDKDATINPTANEKPNNGVDENCDGRDDAARLPSTPQVSFRSQPFRRGVVFATMYVRDLRRGYRVEIRCKRSRSCPRRFRKTVRSGRSVAFKKFRRKAFATGTKIEVFVTTPGNVIGFYKSYVVRGRKNPKQRICDVQPGTSRKITRCR